MIVARVRTPVDLSELLELLHSCGHSVLGYCPGIDAMATAWAQIVLEHGREAHHLRGIWCNNFGNRDASRAEIADATVPIFVTVPEQEFTGAGAPYTAAHRVSRCRSVIAPTTSARRAPRP